MNKPGLIEKQARCDYCGEPCGDNVPKPGKVYHLDCAMEACAEVRQMVQKIKEIRNETSKY